MKSTGVVRRVDDLGRIVIPKEIRRTLRIRDGESLEIFVDREMIALKKFSKMSDMNEVFNKSNKLSHYNMMIMRWHDFDKYCKWLFNILGETEKHVRLCQYATYQRIYGYMSEWLLPIYCEYNRLRIKQSRIFMVTDHSRKHTYGAKCIKNILCNLVFPLYKRLSPQCISDEYWKKWMKIDGIEV